MNKRRALELSAAIVKQRIALGMTQKQFAEYMNVSQGMVSKWESTDYNFSMKALAEIAAKLDLELDIDLKKNKVVDFTHKDKAINQMSAYESNFSGDSQVERRRIRD